VELVVHGNGQVSGTIRKRLLPNGSYPALAFFDDIVITPGTRQCTSLSILLIQIFLVGSYMLEVRSVEDPEDIYVRAPFATVVGTTRVCLLVPT
jgi:hypothetical protein